MNKPKTDHMIAYLQRMGIKLASLEPQCIEAEYFRNIYKVLPRDQVMSQGKPQRRKTGHSGFHGKAVASHA